MKEIIVFKEKHGRRYFDASTPELRNAAALVILQERFRNFWYSPSEEPSNKDILSEEQIAQLPTELLRNRESRVRRDYFSDLRQHEEEVKFCEKVKLAIKNQNAKAAYQLLLERDGGEYEGFNIEELEETNFGG